MGLAFQVNALAQTITSQPQSTTNNNASTAIFTVGASGATSYQWRFNTTNLTDGINTNDGVIISGSATSTLTLEDITTNEAGSYTVVLNGSVTSSNAVLTITNGTIVQFILTGFPGGGASNVDVQLFDHDKPATVENFIHYVSSGAFTNMFFERCAPEILQEGLPILQGGYDGATDRTNTDPPITGWDIARYITNNQFTNTNPPFPAQVDSEFSVGPLIHNHFGTIAMALGSSSNSATSSFFFNLADNSGSLDPQDFTVFGRIVNNSNEMASSNVLAYFNTLTNGHGGVANEVFSDYGTLDTNSFLLSDQEVLPVNYVGTNAPANANLVFCDFTNLTPLPVNTNLPTVSITSPAAPVPVTNLQGTASDDVGLAVVICVLTPQAATDGTYPYPYTGAAPVTNYAVGTANWSLGSLSPGSYNVSVRSQNGAGYLSTNATQSLSVTTIVTNGNGTVTFTNSASNILTAVGYPFQEYNSYDLLATPGPNQLFVSWSNGSETNVNPEFSYALYEAGVLTATFISNGIPNSIALTYPEANAVLTGGTFNITGTISAPASPPVTVTSTIFSQTTGDSVSPVMTTSGTTNWSIPVSNLESGFYVVEVTATDSASNSTAISENFSVGVPLQLIKLGDGTVSGATNGEYVPVGSNLVVTATAVSGKSSFYGWNDGTDIFTNLTETFTMSSNLTLTAEFVSIGAPKVISFIYPTANAKINTNTFPLKVSLKSSAKSAKVTCQIVSLTEGNEVVPPLTLTNTAANTWSVTVSNLPPDEYEIEAVATYDMGGKSTSSAVSEIFYVLAFKQVAGTYTGLFICSSGGPVTPTNSGFFTCTVTASGTFSSRLLFPAYKPIGIDGSFYINNGEGIFDIGGTIKTDCPLNIPGNPAALGYMSLDLTNGFDELTGYVYATNFSWYSYFECYRAVTKLSDQTTPAKGKYIIGLDPTDSPITNGYASLSVSSGGGLTLSGSLPDGASFSQSAKVSKDGVWPLYVVPSGYKTNGMLMGWETNQASNGISGQLYWYKATNTGTYYTNTVDPNVNSTGTNYSPPAEVSYSIVFQEGTNSLLGSNDLSVTRTNGQFVVPKPAPADKLAISLSANGVLTGHIVTNSDSKPLQFKGAFFGQSQGGSGFILDGNSLTDYFLLKQEPP
jgi:cyclophilin family peptidyl-prolyl cis-trans isomerase